jgi:hypothetical protein
LLRLEEFRRHRHIERCLLHGLNQTDASRPWPFGVETPLALSASCYARTPACGFRSGEELQIRGELCR